MKALASILLVGVCAVGLQQPGPPPTPSELAIETYEHLATAIIANREAENSLVKGILFQHVAAARRSLRAALEVSGDERAAYLETAATEISHIANEGDKPVQAIRQRLLQAGHHHHTDAETNDDYIFVDGAAKKTLLDMARRISEISRSATDAQILGAQRELAALSAQIMGAD